MSKNLNYKVDPAFKCIKYVKSYSENNFSEHKYNDHILRADLCPTLISILFNTNNIDAAMLSIKNFIEKAKEPEKIQFCIKVDNSEDFVKNFLDKLKKFPCNFVILSSPKGRGYLDLWQWINHLYKVSSRKSKFVMNISDEIYVNEKNWDVVLKNFESHVDDKIFRLRTSVFKNRNYLTLFECGYAPDTTAIYSKRYLDIQGDFSPCFGPDNGQQFVAYYLATLNYPRHYQFSRDYVIESISFSGQGTNKGLKGTARQSRVAINYLLWQNMFKVKYQRLYYKRARKLQVAMLMYRFPTMKIYHNVNKERYEVRFMEKELSDSIIYLSYKISRIKNLIQNHSKLNYTKYHTGWDQNALIGICFHLYVIIFKSIPSKFKAQKETPDKYSLQNYLSFINNGFVFFRFPIISPGQSKLSAFFFELKILEFIKFIFELIFIVVFCTLTFYKMRNNLIFINRKYNRAFSINHYERRASIILSEDKLDQSKTVVLKGD